MSEKESLIVTNQETKMDVTGPEYLILRAIEENTPVESLEKLLMMRRELREEKAKEAFFVALAKFQNECPIIEKTKEVRDRSGALLYKYAPLDSIVLQVKEYLEKHGFSYTITTEQTNDSATAICHVHHSAGYSNSSSFTAPTQNNSPLMNASQRASSAMTFSKRQSFCNAFGIMTGDMDDDAIGTGEQKTTTEQKTQNRNQNQKQPIKPAQQPNKQPETPASGTPAHANMNDKQKGKNMARLEELTKVVHLNERAFKTYDGLAKVTLPTDFEATLKAFIIGWVQNQITNKVYDDLDTVYKTMEGKEIKNMPFSEALNCLEVLETTFYPKEPNQVKQNDKNNGFVSAAESIPEPSK